MLSFSNNLFKKQMVYFLIWVIACDCIFRDFNFEPHTHKDDKIFMSSFLFIWTYILGCWRRLQIKVFIYFFSVRLIYSFIKMLNKKNIYACVINCTKKVSRICCISVNWRYISVNVCSDCNILMKLWYTRCA